MCEFEKQEMTWMLAIDITEPAQMEWESPIEFVLKKYRKLCFYVEYRKLNAMTIKNTDIIHRMDECIISLGDATMLSTLHAKSRYWQLGIAEVDRDWTTFTSCQRIYGLIWMLLRLKRSLVFFNEQWMFQCILSKVQWQFSVISLDDILDI